MASLRRPSGAKPPSKITNEPNRPRPPMPGNADKKRDARKSKVGDKFKSRLSMRYAGGPEPIVSAAQPMMPGMRRDFLGSDPYQITLTVAPPIDVDDDYYAAATGFTPGTTFTSPDPGTTTTMAATTSIQDEQIRRRGAADDTARDHEEWDFEELGKDGVDLAAYMRRTLAGADEKEKQRFKAALLRQMELNSKELQRNVFKHYAEFVGIAKEITTLENDMLELKELLTEWKSVPQLMGMEDSLAPSLDKDGNLERRRTHRNSALDLQQLYRSQLTTLWSSVEGSQKYLPIVPGRHLVFETHTFVELNAATYKAKQSVSLFLLNDLLLTAGRRRMKTAPSQAGEVKERDRGRMVAERCWVLADLVVIDIKDSGDLTNAMKIKRGKEVCVYRTARPEDKKALLAAFRQVSQELSEKKRKENEKEQERRKTMWHGGEANIASQQARMSTGRPLSAIGTSLTDSKDLRWIDEFGDDLTMAIATRDWDEGVKLVEKGKDLLKTVSSNPNARELLSLRLNSLLPNFINQIAHDLTSPDIRKTSAGRLIALLIRLDKPELARDTFLKARRDLMLRRVRAIKLEGDISVYISELAIVCFTIIRHTSEWYMHAFKENRMVSGFVSWAKDQIDYFADVFRRQVYAPTIEASVADECLRVTASHNRKLLRDVGLDFTFLLSTLTQPDPASSSSVSAIPPFDSSQPSPAAFYIEPSPYVPFVPDNPAPDVELRQGSTAPLSIARRPRGSNAATPDPHTPTPTANVSTPKTPGTPATPPTPPSGGGGGSATRSATASPVPPPPPRSERRARPPPRVVSGPRAQGQRISGESERQQM